MSLESYHYPGRYLRHYNYATAHCPLPEHRHLPRRQLLHGGQPLGLTCPQPPAVPSWTHSAARPPCRPVRRHDCVRRPQRRGTTCRTQQGCRPARSRRPPGGVPASEQE
ncbi:hypothetical protein [Streptomyces collinus]